MLLAVFPAGFLTKEALKLPDISIKSIGRLVQHSLARLEGEGRVTLHPLIAGHARSELEQRPELLQEFHHALSTWCQSFVTSHASENPENSSELHNEIANITSAWNWDAAHGLWQLHQATRWPVRQFFGETGRVSEGRALFTKVINALRADPNHPPELLSASLEALGWFEMLAGELTSAQTRLDEALALSHSDEPVSYTHLRAHETLR